MFSLVLALDKSGWARPYTSNPRDCLPFPSWARRPFCLRPRGRTPHKNPLEIDTCPNPPHSTSSIVAHPPPKPRHNLQSFLRRLKKSPLGKILRELVLFIIESRHIQRACDLLGSCQNVVLDATELRGNGSHLWIERLL